MNSQHDHGERCGSRRTFLKNTCGAVAGTALTGALTAPCHAGEDNTIKLAIVGCGGRGTGALVNALGTAGPTRLWAMADVFKPRIDFGLKNLSQQFGKQVDVPPEGGP